MLKRPKTLVQAQFTIPCPDCAIFLPSLDWGSELDVAIHAVIIKKNRFFRE